MLCLFQHLRNQPNQERLVIEKYIALFRGINVGGNNIIKMSALTALFEQLGYRDVVSYIQSGNIIFTSSEQPDITTLSAEVAQQFDCKPDILLLSLAQLKQFFELNPYKTELGKTVHFYFLAEPSQQADTASLGKLATASESYQLTENIFYLSAPDGIGRPKLAAKVESYLGIKTTARNLNTVNKLLALAR